MLLEENDAGAGGFEKAASCSNDELALYELNKSSVGRVYAVQLFAVVGGWSRR
jgi:hypothetical protein